MINRKSKFWTFCISFMPGAGQMYQGFLKRGASFMLLFFGEIFLSNMLYSNWLLFAMPVIWCYAFFDSLNISTLSNEEFSMLQDKYLFIEDGINFNINIDKIRIPAAVILIITGSYILLENMVYILENIFGVPLRLHIIFRIMDYFPRFVFSVAIIFAGLYLIKGKKAQMDNDNIYDTRKDEI